MKLKIFIQLGILMMLIKNSASNNSFYGKQITEEIKDLPELKLNTPQRYQLKTSQVINFKIYEKNLINGKKYDIRTTNLGMVKISKKLIFRQD